VVEKMPKNYLKKAKANSKNQEAGFNNLYSSQCLPIITLKSESL
jgi:hypothetical protein